MQEALPSLQPVVTNKPLSVMHNTSVPPPTIPQQQPELKPEEATNKLTEAVLASLNRSPMSPDNEPVDDQPSVEFIEESVFGGKIDDIDPHVVDVEDDDISSASSSRPGTSQGHGSADAQNNGTPPITPRDLCTPLADENPDSRRASPDRSAEVIPVDASPVPLDQQVGQPIQSLAGVSDIQFIPAYHHQGGYPPPVYPSHQQMYYPHPGVPHPVPYYYAQPPPSSSSSHPLHPYSSSSSRGTYVNSIQCAC